LVQAVSETLSFSVRENKKVKTTTTTTTGKPSTEILAVGFALTARELVRTNELVPALTLRLSFLTFPIVRSHVFLFPKNIFFHRLKNQILTLVWLRKH